MRLSVSLYFFARKIRSFIKELLVKKQNFKIIGGKLVNLDCLPKKNPRILSFGVGMDLDFEYELIKKNNAEIIAWDPTDAAENYLKSKALGISYFKKAIGKINEKRYVYDNPNENGDYMASFFEYSEGSSSNKKVEVVAFDDVVNQYSPDYIKMDIEGAEYEIIESLSELEVPQISIEFHHDKMNKTIFDTIICIQRMIELGYVPFDYGAWCGRERGLKKYVSLWRDGNVELLFVRKDLSEIH